MILRLILYSELKTIYIIRFFKNSSLPDEPKKLQSFLDVAAHFIKYFLIMVFALCSTLPCHLKLLKRYLQRISLILLFVRSRLASTYVSTSLVCTSVACFIWSLQRWNLLSSRISLICNCQPFLCYISCWVQEKFLIFLSCWTPLIQWVAIDFCMTGWICCLWLPSFLLF